MLTQVRTRELRLQRYEHNPILTPLPDSPWESRAVFNPAALEKDGVIHLLYRAIGRGSDYLSSVGHATSTDGFTFTRQSDRPVIAPRRSYERWSIEDPRLVEVEGTLYLTYVVLTQPPFSYGQRAYTALASTEDLVDFRRYGIITPMLPGVDDRDTVLFPERFGGRYAMLNRPQAFSDGDYVAYGSDRASPSSIWLTFSASLRHWSPGQVLLEPQQWWEAKKIGTGPPPMKTERGWLVLYHGVSADNVYRMGAALLHKDDPRVVLRRLPYPILEPEEPYEIAGDTPRVVFPEGMVLRGDQLLIYYGAADTVCAVASVELSELLDALEATEPISENGQYPLAI